MHEERYFFQLAAKSHSWVQLRQNFFLALLQYALFKCEKVHLDRYLHNKFIPILEKRQELMQ